MDAHLLVFVCAVVAVILAAVEEFQSAGRSLIGWSAIIGFTGLAVLTFPGKL